MESLHSMAHIARALSSFHGIKKVGVLLLSLNGMVFHQRHPGCPLRILPCFSSYPKHFVLGFLTVCQEYSVLQRTQHNTRTQPRLSITCLCGSLELYNLMLVYSPHCSFIIPMILMRRIWLTIRTS